MARTRDQFTGHVWLKALGSDRKAYTAGVFHIDTVEYNLAWLTSNNYLTLAQKKAEAYFLAVYPRLDHQPPVAGRFAASYSTCTLAGCLQAAVNDYGHVLGMTTRAQMIGTPFVRHVQYIEMADPCAPGR